MIKKGEKLVVLPKNLQSNQADDSYKYIVKEVSENNEIMIWKKWLFIFQ